MNRTPDFLIVGGGVLGLRLGLEARRRHPEASVLLVEKEDRCGVHASGRNSGVLHAGFYYATDSLKARFTRDGNRRLTEYCLERDLPINRCGKLVVAGDEGELEGLDLLLERGRKNGVELEEVTAAEARKIEPRVRTRGRALWSPATATVDPGAVVSSFVADAERAGVEIATGAEYLGPAEGSGGSGGRGSSAAGTRGADVLVKRGAGPPERLSAGYLINAAGLHADRVARDFGFSARYRILPFKGLYLCSDEEPGSLRTNIYPVPDLERPFLGVHFTVDVRGRVKIGPTAMPALWREHYRGLENFDPAQCVRILWREAQLFLRDDFGFRRLALEELKKYRRERMVELAGRLARNVYLDDYTTWGEPGIRAQLVDVEENRLVMDFRVEGDARSFHVLNAVSPGFTCCMPFAEHCFDRIEELLGG